MIGLWIFVCFASLLCIASVHGVVSEYLFTCLSFVVLFSVIESTKPENSHSKQLAYPLSTYIESQKK